MGILLVQPTGISNPEEQCQSFQAPNSPQIYFPKCQTHPLKDSLVVVFSVVFPVTNLCCWPVTPALLCRPSCSFSSPLPQYDSRWLTVIGRPFFLFFKFFFLFLFFPPPPPPPCFTVTSHLPHSQHLCLLFSPTCCSRLDVKWFWIVFNPVVVWSL